MCSQIITVDFGECSDIHETVTQICHVNSQDFMVF